MDQCAYVIAYRRDETGERRRNLDAVLRHVEPIAFAEVIVVEVDQVATPDLPSTVNHIQLRDSGPFNKSRAMNVGFAASSAQVVAFADADLISPIEEIELAVASVEDRFDATTPFDRIVDLDAHATAAVLADGRLPDLRESAEEGKRGEGEYLPFCGGLFVTRRELFESVGGFDERFIGWGGEDDALSVKYARSGARLGINAGRPAYHLWHDRPVARYTHANYRANVERLHFLQQCTDDELRGIFTADAAAMRNRAKPNSGQ
ncbi:MAG: glycosyltransferase family 2 protein [Candidatus Nanopelagicales bacterium]